MEYNNIKMITAKEARQIISCSEYKMYKLVNSKGFPALKIGRQCYIPVAQLEKWISKNMYKQVLI